jgi:hypothetical protein
MAAEGDLDITDSGHTVTIQGKGAGVSRVNGNGIDRAFQVLGGANAVFSNMTIEGGVAQDNGRVGVRPGTTASDGGGVLVGGGGHVTLTQVSIEGNRAIGGRGRTGTPATGNGGPGLAARGGRLFLYNGAVNLTGSVISQNTANGGGGGGGFFVQCFRTSGSVLICPGHSGNGGSGGAGAGAGLYVLSGSARLATTTVSGNFAHGGVGGTGGGFFGPSTDGCCASGGSGASAQGGGLFLASGALSLIRTTISGNFANGGTGNFGGGNMGGGGGERRGLSGSRYLRHYRYYQCHE